MSSKRTRSDRRPRSSDRFPRPEGKARRVEPRARPTTTPLESCPRALASTLSFALACNLALSLAGVAHAQPSAAQQGCINAAHKGFASVAKAQGKLLARCFKAAASGKLAEADLETCVAADTKGKVAKAEGKAVAAVAAACTETPDFGPSDITGRDAGSGSRPGPGSVSPATSSAPTSTPPRSRRKRIPRAPNVKPRSTKRSTSAGAPT